MKKRATFLLKVVIAFLLLFFLFSRVNFNDFLLYIQQANVILVILASSLFYAGVYVSVLKWKLFLSKFNVGVITLKLYSIYSIGSFISNFLPTSIGGDVYRIARISSSYKDKKSQVAASVVLERGYGLFAVFFVNFILLPFYSDLFSYRSFQLVQLLIFTIFFLFLALLFFHEKIFQLLKSIFGDRFTFLSGLFAKVQHFKNTLFGHFDLLLAVKAFLYSALFVLMVGVARYVFFLAFGVEVGYWYVLYVGTVIQIVSLLPISLNSIGISEGLIVFLFSLVGIPLEVSLAIALVSRVAMLVVTSLGGLFYFVDKKIPVK